MKTAIDRKLLAGQLPRRTVALILAGGRGTRLRQLTDNRAKPAVHFGGKFRIIDFALSNCINSGIRRIGIVTQYRPHSLIRHLQRGWSFLKGEHNEFIDLMPAGQQLDENLWYRGTADSVLQNMGILRSYQPDYILVLAGDHVYKMNYSQLLLDHVERKSVCTVACLEIPRAGASEFGILAVDDKRKVVEFVEKPENPPGMPGNEDVSLASMGLYVFSANYLYHLLEEDSEDPSSSHDFGRDIIPKVVREGRALAHYFSMSCVPALDVAPPYWRDVGTIDAFWSANLDLTSNLPQLNLYDEDWPIWTYQAQEPPAKFVPDPHGMDGVTANTMVSGGCIVCGSRISNTILFSRVRIQPFCNIDQAVVLPECVIGQGCRLKRVVIDRGCHIQDGTVIGENEEYDARHFYRTPKGVVLVTQEMLSDLYNQKQDSPDLSQ
ncbi:MAG: glucose-1-phosphate adenylyltransferase [Burkholderiaceae bacterium]|jgi:glucose-1-phosphate adenylyltransferase|nr:glucose-1-phosphate adenylyltransferase [Burkholderiaceae bacterium]